MNQKPRTRLDENGFASIVIALIFIIVLALLTVGFAQLARREQQTALDKQLGTQASYAAESGINAAYRDIKNGYITSANADDQNCMKTTAVNPSAATASHAVDSGNGVTYTCLLVQLQTPNLVGDHKTPNTGGYLNFSTQDPLTSMTFYWGSDSGHNSNFPTSTNSQFPSLANWSSSKYPPVVELSLTPDSSLASQSSPTQYLLNNTINLYLYPTSAGGNSCTVGGSCSQGAIIPGGCNPSASRAAGQPDAAAYPCSVTINGLGDSSYLLHYYTFYDTMNYYATGTVGGSPGGGSQVPLTWSSCGSVGHPVGGESCLTEAQANSLRCTTIDEPSDPNGWSDNSNKVCVPGSSDVHLYWTHCAGPDDACPQDASSLASDPGLLHLASVKNGVGTPGGRKYPYCTQWNVPDPNTWTDNWLCSDQDIGLTFGTVGGSNCTTITELADHDISGSPSWQSGYYLCDAAISATNPEPAEFSGEPLIDVTGKARNVLKRLQARLLINGGVGGGPGPSYPALPNSAIEAQNLCKRIQAAPSTTDYPAGSSYDTGTSPACDLSQ
ncbi:MAG TPA: pilus assembly PilX N-terminal domain-containing protein [Candidatus Saccharimonadales bacterium]|nr:pilus assembly PilX N-terminal domain-containing protein [Candidatus Saccharimonadales bacterium]